jgi:hypothetical protein
MVTSLVAVIFTQPAAADPWFLHKYGELRSYHRDWLNICDDAGKGQCRAVQTYIPPGTSSFFGESKLTLYRLSPKKYVLEFYDSGMPANIDGNLIFKFGSQAIQLTPSQWQMGERKIKNVAETLVIKDDRVVSQLVDLIKAKNTLRITYPVQNGNEGVATFSLRGSAAALAAIEQHLQTLTLN